MLLCTRHVLSWLQGWMSWERFRCDTDCSSHPDSCISQRLFQETADSMVADGFLAAGFNHLIIDDCWLDKQRDADGRLAPDPDRFPDGILALADYVHAR